MLEAPEIVAPVLTASVLIAPVLATLVLFAASTGADSTTAGSNVLQAPVLLVPVIVASVLSAILNFKGIYAVLSRIRKCRKSRVFGANFLGGHWLVLIFTPFATMCPSRPQVVPR